MNSKGSRKRDPVTARARILEAAAEEFAARGFAGARVDRIAARAGLNKRMLYHYFTDKRGLHRAVLEHGSAPPGAGLDPRTARLLLWALLEPETSADVRERLPAAAAGSLDGLLGDLAARLLGAEPAARRPRPKPRIRLRHRSV